MSGGAKRSSLNQTLNEIDSFLDIKIEIVSIDSSIFLFIYLTKKMDFLSCVKPQILDLARKDCTALGPGSEGNELGCFFSTLFFFFFRSACASRAIGALFSSYSSLDGSDGLRRSFPTQIEKAVSHRDVDSFSAPNEMGN